MIYGSNAHYRREESVRKWRESQGFGHIVCSDSELKRFYSLLEEFDATNGKDFHRSSTSEYGEILETPIRMII